MTTSDVHVPPFEPLSTSVTRAPAPVPSYYPHQPHHRHHFHQQHRHHPYYLPTTSVFQNSTTDPTLYSLSNHFVHPPPTTPITTAAATATTTARNITATTMVGSIHAQTRMGVSSNSRTNTSCPNSAASGYTTVALATSTNITINNGPITPSEQQQQPAESIEDDTKICEKYRQFLHSNHQERSIMIDKLVDVAAEIIDSIWYPLKDSKVVATRNFIQEILKRSKATYLTLQLSLFYLFRVKGRVHERLQVRRMPSPPLSPPLMATLPVDGPCDQPPHPKKNRTQDIILCGRRMFLASLMVASKYLQDKNYRNKAWAKIAGLDLAEINAAELAFLGLIDYKLFISKSTFDRWYTVIHGLVQKKQQGKTPVVVPAINTNF